MARRNRSTKVRAQSPKRIGINTPVNKALGIPMAFETLLHDELGLHSMLYIHDRTPLSEWRRCLGTYFDSLAKIIRDTCTGDGRHVSEMIEDCYRAARSARTAKTHAAILTRAAADLAWLNFELLGRSAVHREGRQGGQRNWSLARYRGMFYTQTPAQMADFILDCAHFWKDRFKDKVPSLMDLIQLRAHRFKGDNAAFVQWFRETYPKSYAALF